MSEYKKEESENSFNLLIAIPSFIFLFVGTGYFGYVSKPVEMGLAFAIGAFGMGFSCLDKFEYFKGAGVEVKLKKFQQAVDKGKLILEELRNTTLFSAESVLTQVISTGRYGINKRLINETKDNVDNLLSNIKATQTEIDVVEKYWRKYTIIDYINDILENLQTLEEVSSEARRKGNEFREGLMDNPTSPNMLREFLIESKLMTPEGEELIKDYEYYLKNFKHRRPEDWENRTSRGLRK